MQVNTWGRRLAEAAVLEKNVGPGSAWRARWRARWCGIIEVSLGGEMVDAHVSGTCGVIRGSSSLLLGTINTFLTFF